MGRGDENGPSLNLFHEGELQMSTLDDEMFHELEKMRFSFTKPQLQYLLSLVDECVMLGADRKTLAPLYALIFIPFPQPPLTEEDTGIGQEIAKRLGLEEK